MSKSPRYINSLLRAEHNLQLRVSSALFSAREPWPQIWRCLFSFQPLPSWLQTSPMQWRPQTNENVMAGFIIFFIICLDLLSSTLGYIFAGMVCSVIKQYLKHICWSLFLKRGTTTLVSHSTVTFPKCHTKLRQFNQNSPIVCKIVVEGDVRLYRSLVLQGWTCVRHLWFTIYLFDSSFLRSRSEVL